MHAQPVVDDPALVQRQHLHGAGRVPVRDRVLLDVLEDGVVVVVGHGRAGADLAAVRADGEARQGRVGEDAAQVVEGLDGDGAVGGVGVVLLGLVHALFILVTIYLGVCSTYIRVDDGRLRHGGAAERDVAAGHLHHAAGRDGEVGLVGEGRVVGRRAAGVEDCLEEVLDVRLVSELGVDDGRGADLVEALLRQLLEAVGDARGGGVRAGAVGVEFLSSQRRVSGGRMVVERYLLDGCEILEFGEARG